jgi:hypothetical protein
VGLLHKDGLKYSWSLKSSVVRMETSILLDFGLTATQTPRWVCDLAVVAAE